MTSQDGGNDPMRGLSKNMGVMTSQDGGNDQRTWGIQQENGQTWNVLKMITLC